MYVCFDIQTLTCCFTLAVFLDMASHWLVVPDKYDSTTCICNKPLSILLKLPVSSHRQILYFLYLFRLLVLKGSYTTYMYLPSSTIFCLTSNVSFTVVCWSQPEFVHACVFFLENICERQTGRVVDRAWRTSNERWRLSCRSLFLFSVLRSSFRIWIDP
jgi:hypothetical protein